MIKRDTSPATLSLAIPLLRHITEETRGTEIELASAGVLANALIEAGRYAEAEQMERDRIARCVMQGNYRLASSASGNLFVLFRRTGRYEEALRTAEEMAGHTRRAGLGPWTQLSDEVQRLQALNVLGHYAEVLAAVEGHRAQMRALPEESAAEETVDLWNVREGLLDTGREAALRSGQWETALSLNAECVESERRRGADELEIAWTRFNDYGPLLGLRRYPEVRALLRDCRAAFEQESAVYELGLVYGALARLENEEGRPASAARFGQTAMRYHYQTGQPEACAIGHNNLANYIELAGGAPDAVLAHRLAAGIIRWQISSGQLSATVRNLARSSLPPEPPSFAQVCAILEQIEGVRFRELFAKLPQRTPDGDAAIRAVWEMARGFDLEQEGRRRVQEVLSGFEPLLQGIAAVARGNSQPRAEIEDLLPKLEEKGWRIADAVRRLWAGERDAEALTAGLDAQDAALVRRALELLEAP